MKLEVRPEARKAWAALLGAVVLAAGSAICMDARQPADNQEPLVFDVASIKPTPPETRGGIVHPVESRAYEAVGVPLLTIMTVAYTLTPRQISGGPAWINTDRWDIEAKAERRGTPDELHAALARLLEDRFKLQVRHEARELPVYVLTVDKKGPKMALHDQSDMAHEPIGGRFENGELHLTGQNVPMDYFAFFLSRGLDLNVIDRTGLTSRYDVDFHYVPELPNGGRGADGGPAMVNGQPVAADGPTLFTALREQLGLRLEKGKGPVDFLVIEHVEKPSEN